ncbi:hypothetical protein GCM10007103_04020 [Salinimicrobium marinum]|uniref:Uncharacterized protein n=1 Tax=Salinimicrobium marinum TaxID=680283 RepID=A0A918S6R7_9FLAO|nr:hypothetical protein GCM10007103_04020 [Salinimicrobium marinum]
MAFSKRNFKYSWIRGKSSGLKCVGINSKPTRLKETLQVWKVSFPSSANNFATLREIADEYERVTRDFSVAEKIRSNNPKLFEHSW